MFDEEPDADPHGECREEIRRLEAEIARLREGLNVIAGRSWGCGCDCCVKSSDIARAALSHSQAPEPCPKCADSPDEPGHSPCDECKANPPTGKKEVSMTDFNLDAAVNRFLGWKLPDDFNPDGGITRNSKFNSLKPTGTNLLDATQAREMLAYVLGIEHGGPAAPAPGGE